MNIDLLADEVDELGSLVRAQLVLGYLLEQIETVLLL